MHVSQKCQYTLRALFELAKRQGTEPVTVAEIADAQAIPRRFLELIFLDLRSDGMVQSRRGSNGGYVLAVSPETTTVEDVIRAVDGSLAPVDCVGGQEQRALPAKERLCLQASLAKGPEGHGRSLRQYNPAGPNRRRADCSATE